MKYSAQCKSRRTLFALTTVIAVVWAYGLFFWGNQGIFGDAEQYVSLGQQIAAAGLFNFVHEYRTYGYPLLVAFVWQLVGHSPEALRFGVFNLQLLFLISASWYAARVFRRILKDEKFSFALYTCMVLNPLLLVYTTVILSDLLSAVLLTLSVFFSVQLPVEFTDPRLNPTHQVRRSLPEINASLAAFFAGVAVVIRPSSISIILVLVGLWFIRAVIYGERSIRLVALMFVGLCIPFVPQLVNNYRAYQVVQPLVISNSYLTYHLPRGMDLLKYGTVKMPEVLPQLYYDNPFMKSDVSSAFEFLQKYPFEYMVTLGLHAFNLFDYDYAFPYIIDVQPWYRWPISIANYVFLFVTLVGILLWSRRWIRRRRLDRVTFSFLGPLIAAGAYVPIFLFGFIEARYSLPEYMLLALFFLYGICRIRGFWISRLWCSIGITTFGMFLFVLGSAFLSDWVQAQAPSINLVARKFPSADLIQSLPPHRLGERIRLKRYRLEPFATVQGGDKLRLTLFWLCEPGISESHELRTELADTKGRVWATGIHDAGYRVCPAIENARSDEFAGRFTFQLPFLMPPGTYDIILRLYDQSTDQYLAVYNASTELFDNLLQIASPSIAKNKSSRTASKLPIENPYFVDMQEIRLLGYTESPGTVSSGTSFEVGLYWRARTKPRGDYWVVIQVRDVAGRVVLEQASQPADGAYPTSEWDAGEVLKEWYVLNLPDALETGQYVFVVLLRDGQHGQILGQTQLFEFSIVR